MAITPKQTIVGLVGTGVMGKSMAGHFIQAGYKVHIYNRTKSKAQELLSQGAEWQDSPGLLAQQCDVIITMVGFPNDFEEIRISCTKEKREQASIRKCAIRSQ